MERRAEFKLTRREFLASVSGALLSSAFFGLRSQADKAAGPQAQLQVDLIQAIGECDNALWANIGYDPIYAHTVAPESQPAWELIGKSKAFRYIRCHNMFSDGFPGQREADIWGCRVYSEDASGKPSYNWKYLDQVLDTWVKAGLKPILETDFMPDDLASGRIVRNYSGGAINTPKDYSKWRDLIYETVKHCIERYGIEEVRSWGQGSRSAGEGRRAGF